MPRGATIMMSSIDGANEIQQQMNRSNEPGDFDVNSSTKQFCFADGELDQSNNKVELTVNHGLFAGQTLETHLLG